MEKLPLKVLCQLASSAHEVWHAQTASVVSELGTTIVHEGCPRCPNGDNPRRVCEASTLDRGWWWCHDCRRDGWLHGDACEVGREVECAAEVLGGEQWDADAN